MLPSRYLHGIPVQPFEGCEGVFAAPHHRNPLHYRYLCSYRDGKRHKGRIFELLHRYGQPESSEEWDLHHVVEGQHAADVDFGGRIAVLYENELPCVLIHKDEHTAYNRLLHIRATDVIFRDVLPRDLDRRSQDAVASARDRRRHPQLRLRINNLAALYRSVYAGDSVLQQVAHNVFRDALAQLH